MATPTTPERPAQDSHQSQKSKTTTQAPRNLVAETQQNQDLASSREALRKDTCEADVIETKLLLETIYGKLIDVADIRAKLEETQVLSVNGWDALYDSETKSYLPSKSSKYKDAAFGGLATIFQQCIEAAGIRETGCIVQCSVHGPETKFPNNTRPDATLHLTESSFKWTRGVQIDHSAVCLYVEFKKQNNPKNFEDDASKLLWNAHHRFRSDPCCRFVCGLTIENTTARFWHFSRATVLVSKPFDIIEKPDKLIHIFVGSARAKSPAELGFDPTITCITKDPKTLERHYAIQVSDNKDKEENLLDKKNLPGVHTFITHRTISNYRAVGIRSRGTWVWEAIEKDQQKSFVVIKDVWIDADREVEGAILEHVRDTLKNSPNELQFFLEPLCHGCVLIDGERDLTQPLLSSTGTTSFIYSNKPASSQDPTTGSKHTSEKSVGSPPHTPAQEPVVISRRGNRRKHYRIVFKGKAGQALHDISSPREYFTGLLGGVKALHALHRAGYIHRDLSTGNILLVKGAEGEEDHGVLIDLEYAKKFPDISEKCHDVRTGTREFMAVEVNERDFLFSPKPKKALRRNAEPPPLAPIVPWFHNPIHDTESAWWIALWPYLHVDNTIGSLFHSQATRMGIIALPAWFERRCSALPRSVLTFLDDWLSSIRGQYQKLEAKVPKGSHNLFNYNDVFETAIESVEELLNALAKESDFAFPGKRLASVTDGPSPKHQDVQKQDDEDSS